MTDKDSNVVRLRFSTFQEAVDNEQEVLREFGERWELAFKTYDDTMAKIASDQDELSKSAVSNADDDGVNELRKLVRQPEWRVKLQSLESDAVALRKSNDKIRAVVTLEKAKQDAVRLLKDELDAAVKRRDERLYGATAVAKRTLRFARSNPTAFYGKPRNER